MSRTDLLERLKSLAPDLRDRYGVARLGVFGSVARGDASDASDIDLIAEFAPGEAPGLKFFALETELSAALGRPVQISGLDRMNAHVRAQVERDLIYV